MTTATKTKSASWSSKGGGFYRGVIREHASNELPGEAVWGCEHDHFSPEVALGCAMYQLEILPESGDTKGGSLGDGMPM